jgi:Fur family ferric uptake transcriptional regulator/Fur family zinc uptake transcriptional regulator
MPKSPARTSDARLEIRTLLKGSRLRCTPAREAVLHLLCRVRRPLAHAQIAAARGMAGLDRVTVYRTLSALQEAGLVHRVQDKDGVWRFCAHRSREEGCPGNHPHFLCMRCGEMRCLTDQSLPWVETSGGEQVMGKQLVVYGLCAVCASR